MKIKDIIQETPEISEEKLIEIIDSNLKMMNQSAKNRIRELHKEENNLAKAFLDEYDLIQDKKSYLTKGQRDQIVGFVGLCMIQMTKSNE
jgi:replicative DNA helicase